MPIFQILADMLDNMLVNLKNSMASDRYVNTLNSWQGKVRNDFIFCILWWNQKHDTCQMP